MKNLIVIAFCFSAFLMSLSAYSQENPMEKLSVMVGQWEGMARQQDQSGSHDLRQTEDVKFMLGGDILVVKGSGYDHATDSLEFEAFGVIHWDAAASEYKFNAYSMGRQVMAHAKFEDENFIWWFDTPDGGTVRYTLQLSETTWIEDGAYSRDGNQWFPFFHMELKKK